MKLKEILTIGLLATSAPACQGGNEKTTPIQEAPKRGWGEWENEQNSLHIANALRTKLCTSFAVDEAAEKAEQRDNTKLEEQMNRMREIDARAREKAEAKRREEMEEAGEIFEEEKEPVKKKGGEADWSMESIVRQSVPQDPFIKSFFKKAVLEEAKRGNPQAENPLPSQEFLNDTEEALISICLRQMLDEWLEMESNAGKEHESTTTYMKHIYAYYEAIRMAEVLRFKAAGPKTLAWQMAQESPYYGSEKAADPKNPDPYYAKWKAAWQSDHEAVREQFRLKTRDEKDRKWFDETQPAREQLQQMNLALFIPWMMRDSIGENSESDQKKIKEGYEKRGKHLLRIAKNHQVTYRAMYEALGRRFLEASKKEGVPKF